MTEEQHHHAALVETARAELNRAHAAAVAMDAAELRRGLELALDAVRGADTAAAEAGGDQRNTPGQVRQAIEQALAELDSGRLADMERHIEQARAGLTE